MNSAATSVDALTLTNSERPLAETITLPTLFNTLCETDVSGYCNVILKVGR